MLSNMLLLFQPLLF